MESGKEKLTFSILRFCFYFNIIIIVSLYPSTAGLKLQLCVICSWFRLNASWPFLLFRLTVNEFQMVLLPTYSCFVLWRFSLYHPTQLLGKINTLQSFVTAISISVDISFTAECVHLIQFVIVICDSFVPTVLYSGPATYWLYGSSFFIDFSTVILFSY